MIFAFVVLVAANAVTPVVAVMDDWARYGTTFGTVVPGVIVAVQLAASVAVVAIGMRPPTGKRAVAVALLVIGVTIAGSVAMLPGPSALYTTYTSTTVWVPIALSSIMPGLLGGGSTDRRDLVTVWVLLGVATVLAAKPWEPSLATTANGVLHVAVPALIGMYVAARIRMVQALRDRADRAEREQYLLAERARADERARLASEMHDVVSHRISLMVLQAGALRVNAPDDATRGAAEELRAAGCQALDELRDVVGVLRRPPAEPSGASPGAVPEPEPAPDLDALVAASRAAGLDAELCVHGDPGLAAPVVARTVHRVAREALTNAGKYALGASVTVTARYDAARVRLRVHNSAPPAGPGDARLRATGAGSGLDGLRQRVEVVGGAFTAGPGDDGGFTVEATLPSFVPAAEPRPTPPTPSGLSGPGDTARHGDNGGTRPAPADGAEPDEPAASASPARRRPGAAAGGDGRDVREGTHGGAEQAAAAGTTGAGRR